MSQEKFANQRALIAYAAAHDLAYIWEGMHAFARRWLVAQSAQLGAYQLVEVATKRGVSKALLFPKAILRAEAEVDRPFREALAFKRERLAANRSTKLPK